ncbi:T9SS ring complex lipoprotein PorK/GldK [Mangrovibacterium diazotrophicum]|uniref:Protein involved in gliding motility GldK n=1 Tax=Mangrovibacterium diazotrophicum TaxID=1261403 RepID=A0A419W653_9BACT|nr:SUMF1/EgtB/PvdO family nonheme iron enzyme [Mangrovibacterium diazotrophicum]RKD90948.1 protein involved in gliding motility GldK [Mangrovibacterium diazotrophicum]
MKKITLFISLIALLQSCSNARFGELSGVKSKSFHEPTPYGMSFVRQGAFNLGPDDQEVAFSNEMTKTVSLDAFWMDDSEVTNSEYRQFVNWVRDSIARTLLAERFPEYRITEDRKGNPLSSPRLNWKPEIGWGDFDQQEALQPLFIPDEERFGNRREIDARRLFYSYEWIDLQQAAKRANSYNFNSSAYDGFVFDEKGNSNRIVNRASFIMKDMVNVYPDTLCWVRDFTYSYNDPRTSYYFYHPAFEEYPVVGVSWKQAKAFCAWRTELKNSYMRAIGDADVQAYRLPTEAEWEYAARGHRLASMYPWGGYYARNQNGDFQANFKPLRGNYVADGGMAAAEIRSYDPNDYGLYDMGGNVAEWTSNAYDESAYEIIHDLNPNYEYNARPDDPAVLKRKVVRGGSWKDAASYQQVGTRSYEYQDSAKSYIGFRCVRTTFCEDFSASAR